MLTHTAAPLGTDGSTRPGPALRLLAALALLLLASVMATGAARADPTPAPIPLAQAMPPPVSFPEPTRLRVLGGLADVSQYTRFEEPFWRSRIVELTGGRITAEIAPFDRAGFRAQQMLQLMRLGVVPFGTALLAVVATDEPEFSTGDLTALNPNMAALRETTRLFRPRLQERLREDYGVELLAVYTYPAQVIWCNRGFGGLSDLVGRRIRVSSVGQAEFFTALGATPVVTPFAEIVAAIRSGVVECAVTGTLSGMAIGLHQVTSHISPVALSWGVSVFGANAAAWDALPEQDRSVIRAGLADLEAAVWEGADRETGDGIACATGQLACPGTVRGRLTLVPATPADDARRRALLTEIVLPGWVSRCGADCVTSWNRYMAPTLGLTARE